MIYMDTMAGPGLMGIVVPMGQRQQRKYMGVNPVTMNRYLSRFEALCNWYTSYYTELYIIPNFSRKASFYKVSCKNIRYNIFDVLVWLGWKNFFISKEFGII